MRPFAVIRQALDAAQLDALRAEADALAVQAPPSHANGCVCEPLSDQPRGAWRTKKEDYVSSRKLPPNETIEQVLFEALPQLASAHLQGAVVLFNEHYVVKPPQGDVGFRWHSDAALQIPNWSDACPRYVSCWCALDDCDEGNGCLVVRRGDEVVPVRCKAGDVILIADDCVHSSGANSSSSARRAYYAQYSRALLVNNEGPLRLAIRIGAAAPVPAAASNEPPAAPTTTTSAPPPPAAPLAPAAGATPGDAAPPRKRPRLAEADAQAARERAEGERRELQAREEAEATRLAETREAEAATARAAAERQALEEAQRVAAEQVRVRRANLGAEPDIDECLRELRAEVGQAVLDAPDASLLEAASMNQDNPEAWKFVCDKAYGVLHDPTKHWKQAPIAWRRCYAVASYYRASLLPDTGEAIGQCDMGLMLGCPKHRPHLVALIDALDPEPPPWAGPFVRPPMANMSCRSVSSLTDVLRLAAPAMTEFKERCWDASTPCVLEHCMDHWPALAKWPDLGYLDHIAGRRLVPVERGRHYLDEAWSETLMPLSQFLREHVKKGDSQAYLAQHALFDQIPRLRRDVATPDYCALGDSEVRTNCWIGYCTKSPLHRDESHNLLAQVVGTKYVRLYAPSESDKLYPVQDGVHAGVSSRIADLDAFSREFPRKRRDAVKEFPLFEDAAYTDLVLMAGEVLYIPPGWWHYVEAFEYSCSVSFWWK